MGQRLRKIGSWDERFRELRSLAEERNDIDADFTEIEEWINKDGKYYYKVKLTRGSRVVKDILGDQWDR